MAVFCNDLFTGTAGTLLTGHTPNTGGSWTAAGGSTSQLTAAGRLRGAATGEADYVCNGTPASANYDVQVDVVPLTLVAGSYGGVLARSDASAGGTAAGAYLAYYDNTAAKNRWTLEKGVSGVYTLLGSSAQTLTAGNSYTMVLQVRTASQVVTVAGSAVITTTDSAVTATGKAGLLLADNAAPGDSVDMQLDNFSATDAVVASTFPPIPALYYRPILAM